jgi:arylsulfatase A-like enzyme
MLIFLPDQSERVDIYNPTSALDVIPTLLHLAGLNFPQKLEGAILPPFANSNPNRSIFAMDARDNHPDQSLSLYTAMLRKGPYKFTQYYGYQQLPDHQPFFELYNLEEDPEELDNLIKKEVRITKEMREELAEKIFEKDQPH